MKNRFLVLIVIMVVVCSCNKDNEDLNSSEGIFNKQNGLYSLSSDMLYTEQGEISNNENYAEILENPFVNTSDEPVSTFAIDADGGAYANARRYINNGSLPPVDAVRTEEFINYFIYDYPESLEHPMYAGGEVCICPWDNSHKIIRVGMKGKTLSTEQLPASNIVLLIDVSGSMGGDTKLPLLKQSFNLLVDKFTQNDRIAIVTYAGYSEVALQSTNGSEKDRIKAAINKLGAGGSTAGAQGIVTAYKIAMQNKIEGGNNRIILASDGDFNVGLSNVDALVELIEEKRELGIFLTTLGVGSGNLNDAMMEQIANNGNGNYEYIDNINQGKKVFIDEYHKFYTVAKDVKLQVEFNPQVVKQYRLIGYENRVLANEDFEDDSKDAGELGSGQSITALYEIVPNEQSIQANKTSFEIKLRYKFPDENQSSEFSIAIQDSDIEFGEASESTRFASAAAGLGLLIRNSRYKGNLSYDKVISWANDAKQFDPFGYKLDFVNIANKAKEFPPNE